MATAMSAGVSRRAVLACVAIALGCAGAPTVPTRAAPTPPDLHGEILALLPRDPIAWLRIDTAALRRSPHYEPLRELRHAEVETLRQEVGVDVLAESQMAVVALYAPPASATTGWPVLIVRSAGAFDQEAILAAARARSPQAEASEARTEGTLRYRVVGQRAYAFPAADVMVVMERGMVRRVAARLSGQHTHSALVDPRFEVLWTRAGAEMGTLTAAADLAALRAHSGTRIDAPEAETLRLAVGRADGPGEVTVHLSAETASAAAAQTVRETVDAACRQAAGQWELRLLGLARLLEHGITARNEGIYVDVTIQATEREASRAMRAAHVAQAFQTGE